MNNLHFAEFQQRLKKLTDNTLRLLLDTGNGNLAKEMEDELAEAADRKELKLAFVGQYSSGKSTIISALTGNKDIQIDANVATDKVSEYHWNNIVLMDTPGILAGKVERHDEATKEALSQCDLIFYVLTSQLFDDVLFNNFIDLAYTQHLADKMFIVVNKMNMECGDYDDLVNNYLISLNTIFSERGFELSAFPIAFIDTNDFIEGIEDDDDDFITLSHFEQFIDKLNSFVSRKGLIKKQFDTPVRILQSYVKNVEVSSVDEQLAEFYRQVDNKLNMAQRETKRDVDSVLYSFESATINEVVKLASEIGMSGNTEETWKLKQNALNELLSKEITKASIEIEKVINSNYERLMEQMEEFSQKEALQRYQEKLDARLGTPGISIEEQKSLNRQRNVVIFFKNGATTIGKTITESAKGVDSLFGGISKAAGSKLHNFVLNVGHFFGKNFKPWEAVRWASNIAKFAKFGIPIVTTGLDIWMQCREAKKEEERLLQIKDCKNRFITDYQSEIKRIKEEFEHYLKQVLENYNQKRDEVNASKMEIIKLSQKNDKFKKRISELEGEYVDFIEVIDKE